MIILNKKLQQLGILLTMFDSRNNLSRQVVTEVKNHFKSTVFDTVIPRNVKLSESPSHGKPVLLYDISSTGSQSYLNLAQEVIKRLEGTDKAAEIKVAPQPITAESIVEDLPEIPVEVLNDIGPTEQKGIEYGNS